MNMFHLLSRQPHLTHEEFIDHWRNVHGEMARKHRDLIGMQRYAQFHPGGYERATEAMNADRKGEGNFGGEWDGVAIAWVGGGDSASSGQQPDADRAAKAQAAMAEIMEDEPRFSNYPRSVLLFTDAVPIVGSI